MMWNSRVLIGLVLVCIGLATVSGEAKPKANPDPKAKADPKADAKAKAKAQWGQPMYDPRRVVADVRASAYDPRAAARADPRRVDPRRAAAYDPRRVDPRRADPRRADPRRADPRRADPRRADPRRADPRRADPRRAPAYDPRRAPSRTPYVPRAAPVAPRRAPAPYVPRAAPRRAPAPYAPRQAANGQWGPWSNTGACSVTCGSGWQGRKRTCSAGPRGCPGKNNEYVACVLSPCQSAATRGTQAARPPTMTYTDPRNSPNGVLNSYNPRVAPVAPRRADPRRADPRRADPRRADPRRVDSRRQPVAPRRAPYVPQRRVSAGSWAPWRNSGDCSVTCGKGWERRARECIGGTAGRGGCPGKYSEFVACQKQACVSRSRSVPSYQPRRQPDRRQPVYQPRRQPARQPFRQQVRQPVYQPTRVQSGGSGGQCPATHPWAFKNGQMCCKFEYQGDGSDINARSFSCRNDQKINCNGGQCQNYQNLPYSSEPPTIEGVGGDSNMGGGGPQGSMQCPVSHPYAFMDGFKCCSSDMEDFNAQEGPTCDGKAIQFDSTCCKGRMEIECPFARCTNLPANSYGDPWTGGPNSSRRRVSPGMGVQSSYGQSSPQGRNQGRNQGRVSTPYGGRSPQGRNQGRVSPPRRNQPSSYGQVYPPRRVSPSSRRAPPPMVRMRVPQPRYNGRVSQPSRSRQPSRPRQPQRRVQTQRPQRQQRPQRPQQPQRRPQRQQRPQRPNNRGAPPRLTPVQTWRPNTNNRMSRPNTNNRLPRPGSNRAQPRRPQEQGWPRTSPQRSSGYRTGGNRGSFGGGNGNGINGYPSRSGGRSPFPQGSGSQQNGRRSSFPEGRPSFPQGSDRPIGSDPRNYPQLNYSPNMNNGRRGFPPSDLMDLNVLDFIPASGTAKKPKAAVVKAKIAAKVAQVAKVAKAKAKAKAKAAKK